MIFNLHLLRQKSLVPTLPHSVLSVIHCITLLAVPLKPVPPGEASCGCVHAVPCSTAW